MSDNNPITNNKLFDLFFLSDNNFLRVSSDPRELELEGIRCLATYEVYECDIEDLPARAVIMKLLECYLTQTSNPGEFPDNWNNMPGWHIAELLAVAFSLGAEWAHNNPDDPSGHHLDVSA